MSALSVIYLDDDPFSIDFVKAYASQLETAFNFRFFSSEAQAQESHKENPADIFISDLRLGAASGLDVIDELEKQSPDSIYMLASGAADLSAALTALNDVNVFKFLLKPLEFEKMQWGLNEAHRALIARRMDKISKISLGAFENVRSAAAILDDQFSLLYTNAAGEAVIQDRSLFNVGADNILRGSTHAHTQELHNFLIDVRDDPDNADALNILRLARVSDESPLVISARYSCADDMPENFFSLILSDPNRRDFATADMISKALNINPSEARVVWGLIDGGTVDEAAARSGVSVNTARTYLKTVFSKTGVSKQAELVRLALSSLP